MASLGSTFALVPRPQDDELLAAAFGLVLYPLNPCITAGEDVPLAGDTHVVTQVGPTTLDIYLNMAGIQGTGETSGSLYIGTGSAKVIGLQHPPSPCFPVAASFTLQATNGCADVPLPLLFQLCLASEAPCCRIQAHPLPLRRVRRCQYRNNARRSAAPISS
jgi:hypothetical protein